MISDNNKLSTIKNQEIRRNLSQGDLSKIKKATGYSYSYVVKVLSGKRNSNKIVMAALMILDNAKKIEQEISSLNASK